MIDAALSSNALGDRRLLDSSSGNAGIAYAMIGAALKIPVTLVVPGNASRERLDRIRAHGAELILTDPIEGYDYALNEARRLGQETDRFLHVDQYSNDENWRSHFFGTGTEIVEQMTTQLGRLPDAFVCGVGTGGTLTGVGRRLREEDPDIFLGVAIPDVFPGIEGLKPLGAEGDIVPAILDETLITERIDVGLEEALAACHALARAGLFVGPSSGAFLWAAVELAKRHGFETAVTPLCDTGERYVSTGLWEQ
jgi:cysteine synthase B